MKSTRNLAGELTEMGHAVSHSVVAKILHPLQYSLQGTRKTLEGHQHPDRDAQFQYLNCPLLWVTQHSGLVPSTTGLREDDYILAKISSS